MISTIHPIPAFSDNYIWAVSETGSNNVCVVDPGDATPVIQYLNANHLVLSDILITHHHPDHTGGIAELTRRYPARVTGPKPSAITGITDYVAEGNLVELFGHSFSVIEVPGHTLDHIAFYCADTELDKPILFCGDTLFAAGCGRLFEGTPIMMQESLSKLAALDPSTNVYCTHEYTLANLKFALAAEPDNLALQRRNQAEASKREANLPTLPSSVELELATNPFLRCTQQTVIRSAYAQLGRDPKNEVEVFSALRAWKDTF